MLVIGLTGGIASGKSTATDYFARRGVPIIDADRVAREVVEPGTKGLVKIVEAFGEEVLGTDGGLDRRKLREIVFADKARRQTLERILHPLIHEEIGKALRELKAPWVILSIPLLVGSQLLTLIDRVLVIDTSPSIQINRLMLRDEIDKHHAETMLNAQATREQRLAIADDVADNSSTSEALLVRLGELYRLYSQLAISDSTSAPISRAVDGNSRES